MKYQISVSFELSVSTRTVKVLFSKDRFLNFNDTRLAFSSKFNLFGACALNDKELNDIQDQRMWALLYCTLKWRITCHLDSFLLFSQQITVIPIWVLNYTVKKHQFKCKWKLNPNQYILDLRYTKEIIFNARVIYHLQLLEYYISAHKKSRLLCIYEWKLTTTHFSLMFSN